VVKSSSKTHKLNPGLWRMLEDTSEKSKGKNNLKYIALNLLPTPSDISKVTVFLDNIFMNDLRF
jgi:hypothetical protein